MEIYPTVMWAILAKQAESTLPLYLKCLMEQKYPKDKISLYIRTNDNTDRTTQILEEFLISFGDEFKSIHFDKSDINPLLAGYRNHEWNATRWDALARIREDSINAFRKSGNSYYFVSDVDNFIVPETLEKLISLDLPIVAPMLTCSNQKPEYEKARYSNFHSKIDAEYNFIHDDQYSQILDRQIKGVFEVPLVHCTYLIKKEHAQQLSYLEPHGNWEYRNFSISAHKAKVPQYIDNSFHYGNVNFEIEAESIIKDLENQIQLNKFSKRFSFVCLNQEKNTGILQSRYLNGNSLKEHLLKSFKVLELEDLHLYNHLEFNNFASHNEDFKLENRPENWRLGEIGQLVSYFKIARKMIQSNQEFVLILENDMWINSNFNIHVMNVISSLNQETDFISLYCPEYQHAFFEDTTRHNDILVKVFQTEVTGAMILTRSGAEKLLEIFKKGIKYNIDEFFYKTENLNGLSVNPRMQQSSVYTNMHSTSTINHEESNFYSLQMGNKDLQPIISNKIDHLKLSKDELFLYTSMVEQFRSQAMQDLAALKFNNFKNNGYFVEFGAGNGLDISNTYVLEKMFRWQGILAEPAKVFQKDLEQIRSAKVVNKCVYSSSGDMVQFNETSNPILSSVGKFAGEDRLADWRFQNTKNIYEVPTISLADLLREGDAPRIIDFLSIDTEGSEYEVIRDFPFDQYSFNFICIQHNFSTNREKIYNLLLSKGYQRVFSEISGVDDWFANANSEFNEHFK